MNSQNDKHDNSTTVDAGRRKLLEVVGAGAVVSAISPVFAAESPRSATTLGNRRHRWDRKSHGVDDKAGRTR